MLQRVQVNSVPQLCCAATGVEFCESEAADGAVTERIVERLSQTIFGYRYLFLRMWYDPRRER